MSGFQVCELKSCEIPGPHWVIGKWSSCSKSCGSGTRHRDVHCESLGQKIPEENCLSSDHGRPEDHDVCDQGSCVTNIWLFSDWSPYVSS